MDEIIGKGRDEKSVGISTVGQPGRLVGRGVDAAGVQPAAG